MYLYQSEYFKLIERMESEVGCGVKWFGNIPGNGVHCQDKCEKEEDVMQSYTVYNDLGELKKVER